MRPQRSNPRDPLARQLKVLTELKKDFEQALKLLHPASLEAAQLRLTLEAVCEAIDAINGKEVAVFEDSTLIKAGGIAERGVEKWFLHDLIQQALTLLSKLLVG